MAHKPLPSEGAGWRAPFIGPWTIAATSLKSLDAMVCQPDPIAYAVGAWFGTLHFLVALTKPVSWAPSLGEVTGGVPHGGRRRGRNRERNKSKMRFKTVFNLTPEYEAPLDNGLKFAAFKLGSIALEVGYIIFLADIIRDSLVAGTSAAYRYQGCIPASVGPAYGHNLGQVMTPFGQQRVSFADDYDPDNLIAVNRFYIPAGSNLTFAYSIKVSRFPPSAGPIGEVYTWVLDESANVKIAGAGTSTDGVYDENGYTMGNRFQLPASSEDRVYGIHAACRGGFALLTDSTINITDSYSLEKTLLFDP